MSSARPLSALLFAAVAAPGWFAVAASLGGLSVLDLSLATLAGTVASGTAGAIAGPTLAAEARGGAALLKGAVLGVLVSALGVVVGAVVVGVIAAGASVALPETVAGAVAALLFPMLPWLTLGAVSGAAFYYLSRDAVRGAV